MATKRSKVGLNAQGRIDWESPETLSCFALANYSPFYGKVIGNKAGGLTQGQVYERCKQFGNGLKSIRNGKSPVAHLIVQKYSVDTMKTAVAKELLAELERVKK